MSAKLYLLLVLGSAVVLTSISGYRLGIGVGIGLGAIWACSCWVIYLAWRIAQYAFEPETLREAPATTATKEALKNEYRLLRQQAIELDLDFSMGKVSEETYGRLKEEYRQRAARILVKIDEET